MITACRPHLPGDLVLSCLVVHLIWIVRGHRQGLQLPALSGMQPKANRLHMRVRSVTAATAGILSYMV